MVDAILQVKTTLEACAAEARALFGRGGAPEAAQPEGFLGYVNTPMVGGYVRVRIDDDAARQLEEIRETDNARLIRMEWPELGPWGPFQAGEEQVLDEAGNPTGETLPVYLGTIA